MFFIIIILKLSLHVGICDQVISATNIAKQLYSVALARHRVTLHSHRQTPTERVVVLMDVRGTPPVGNSYDMVVDDQVSTGAV
jgi:hypothetical protein